MSAVDVYYIYKITCTKSCMKLLQDPGRHLVYKADSKDTRGHISSLAFIQSMIQWVMCWQDNAINAIHMHVQNEVIVELTSGNMIPVGIHTLKRCVQNNHMVMKGDIHLNGCKP